LAWSRADLARIAELEGFNVSFRDLRLSSDGWLLAAPAWDGHVATWDTRSWQRTGAWKAHEDYARCVAFHPRRPILATGGGDTTLKLWSSAAPGEMSESLNLAAKVEAACFWADGAGITAALEDGRLVLCSYEA
jgi:WD40 repeat protein